MTRRERKYAKVDLAMERFGKIPKDFSKFIEKKVVRPYLFYSKKDNTCYCNKCHRTFPPPKSIKHNAECECPKCKVKAKARSAGIRRTKAEIGWSVIVENDGGDMLTRYFKSVIRLDDYKHPTIQTTEEYRNIISEDSFDEYMYWYITGTNEWRWMNAKKRGMGMQAYTSEYYTPYYVVCYTDLDEVIKDSPFKYSCLKGLLTNVCGTENGYILGMSIDGWLLAYRNRPYIEKLYKVGFYKLTDYATEWAGRDKFAPGKDIYEVMGINKAQYRLLRSLGNPTSEQYEIVKESGAIDREEYEFVRALKEKNRNSAISLIKAIKDYVPLKKFKRYYYKEKFYKEKFILSDYRDYVTWLAKLGYDMHDDYYLFPKDYKTAHDRVMKEYQDKEDAIKAKQRALQTELMKQLKLSKENIETLKMHYNGLFIMIADSYEQLRQEGAALHHCVATYADKVANGETMILFIREEKAPDVPYYTMEFRDGRIAQLRGAHNCVPNKEVKEFSEVFEARLKQELHVA